MDDFENMIVISPDIGEFWRILNATAVALPPDLRKKFNAIRSDYVFRLSREEMFGLMNGRTIRQIIEEYKPKTKREIICSGQMDGVNFVLYGPDKSIDPLADSHENDE